uniref:Uncharacterized protein n=1 Tax=Aegilops tauschii subsp. strangulata TaxID=200361 RepID=A0A453EYU6_AEGTS
MRRPRAVPTPPRSRPTSPPTSRTSAAHEQDLRRPLGGPPPATGRNFVAHPRAGPSPVRHPRHSLSAPTPPPNGAVLIRFGHQAGPLGRRLLVVVAVVDASTATVAACGRRRRPRSPHPTTIADGWCTPIPVPAPASTELFVILKFIVAVLPIILKFRVAVRVGC